MSRMFCTDSRFDIWNTYTICDIDSSMAASQLINFGAQKHI